MPEPFRGCWSFCTPDCRLRAADGCRKQIPRYDLPPPNEGVDSICHLKHGRADYDDHPAVRAYYLERGRWWANGKEGPAPIHWRERVGDKWAGIYIHEDPEHRLDNYSRVSLYDPLQLQDMLLDSPRIVRAVHAAIEVDCNTISMRRLQKELLSFFRLEFREAVSTGNFDEVKFEKRTLKFLEQTVDLIAQCLLVNYELYPLDWSVRVLRHAEVSDKWKKKLEALQPAKPKIEMVAAPSGPAELNIEPPYIEGLIYE